MTENTEKEYLDELYQIKQQAARRKLAYDYNLVGRVNKQRSSTKDWGNTNRIGRARNRLAMSFQKESSVKQISSSRGLSYF